MRWRSNVEAQEGGMSWQVGDLAVCVDVQPREWSTAHLSRLTQGAIYTVVGLRHYQIDGLHLEGIDNPHAFDATRFRKILPDKHESCEPEFVTLLKRTKVRA
jgi:hypothetical protein